ncbi:MAG: hypothetical protein EXQ70_10530 [Solirubrobacterales bacterium]|nr:hypothetical protein [Solirubrobacterales bacterium]
MAGPGRSSLALRNVDLLVLAAGLPVFLLAGLPMLGYAVLAGVWLAQAVVEYMFERRANRALGEGNRQAAMGWTAVTTLTRVWVIALAVLLVGLQDREAGLAAAVLAMVLFTIHLAARVLTRLFESAGDAP